MVDVAQPRTRKCVPRTDLALSAIDVTVETTFVVASAQTWRQNLPERPDEKSVYAVATGHRKVKEWS